MKPTFIPAALALLLALACGKPGDPAPTLPAPPSKAKWLTDLDAALAQAKKEAKLVLVDFTGSDWCRPCIELHENVFAQPAFAAYAKEHLVLVELDYPMRKPQPAALKQANAALKEKYQIEGWPTVIVMDPAGKVLHRLDGYDESTAEQYIAALKQKLGR